MEEIGYFGRQKLTLKETLKANKKPMKQYLLVEDDHAPDGGEYFDKRMKEKFGFTSRDFREKGIRLDTPDDMIAYEYQGYVLESFAEEPYGHLRKSDQ